MANKKTPLSIKRKDFDITKVIDCHSLSCLAILPADIGARPEAVSNTWRTFRGTTRWRLLTASHRHTRCRGRGSPWPRCPVTRRSPTAKHDTATASPTGHITRRTGKQRRRKRRKFSRTSRGRWPTRRACRIWVIRLWTRPIWRINASTDWEWSITGWRPRASELEHVSMNRAFIIAYDLNFYQGFALICARAQ